MATSQTLIDVQQEYVDTVNSCFSSHVTRVRGGAVNKLIAALHKQGFEYEQVAQAMKDADEMMLLERNGEDLGAFGSIARHCRDAGVVNVPTAPTSDNTSTVVKGETVMATEKTFEVGGLKFTAIRQQVPLLHWVLRIDENGEVLEAGAGGISTESVPKMQASVHELFERVSKNDVADFRRRFGLPTQPLLTKVPMPSSTLTNGILRRERGSGVYHDIFKDGVFIIGSQTEEEAAQRLKDLEANNWTHLDCYTRGHPDPVEWVEYVRSKDWTFQLPGIDYNEDGRMFFYGNLQEYSGAFRYLILDQKLTEKIVAMAPEVPIRRYGLDGNELPESIFDGVVKGLTEEYPSLGEDEVFARVKENILGTFQPTGNRNQDHRWLRNAVENELQSLELAGRPRM